VNLGRDKIMDLGDSAILSEGILSILKERGVSTLAQESTNSNLLTGIEHWKRSDDVGLRDAQENEWDLFTIGVSQEWITLQADEEDKIIWIGGDSSGKLMVKNCYYALISIQYFSVMIGWKTKLWRWRIQLKIILFFWLAIEHYIITWEVLRKRGWMCPRICHLCR
jgi:hypothetical protein